MGEMKLSGPFADVQRQVSAAVDETIARLKSAIQNALTDEVSRMQLAHGEAERQAQAAESRQQNAEARAAELDRANAEARAVGQALDAQNEAKRQVGAELDAQVRALHDELDQLTTALAAARRLGVPA